MREYVSHSKTLKLDLQRLLPRKKLLQWIPTLDNPNQEEDNRYNQEQVNKTAQKMRYETEEPKT